MLWEVALPLAPVPAPLADAVADDRDEEEPEQFGAEKGRLRGDSACCWSKQDGGCFFEMWRADLQRTRMMVTAQREQMTTRYCMW